MKRLWIVAVLCVAAAPALAEEVRTKSGEVFRGKLVSRDDQKLVLEHPYLGKIVIPAAQVDAVAPWPVEGAPAAPAAPATPAPPAADAAPPAAAPPAAAPAPPPEEGFTLGWKAQLEVGVAGSTGNTDQFNGHVGFLALKETPTDRWKFDTAYFKSVNEGTKTKNYFTLGVIKDWLFPGSKWFWWADGRFDYDEFRSWKERLSGHTGPGYTFVDEDRLKVIGRAGGGANKEWGSREDDIQAEASVGGEVRWKINDRQSLDLTSTVFPDLTDLGEFRARNTLDWAIKIDQMDGMSLKIGLIHDYESKVDPGRKRNDLTYFGALVWDF